MINLCIVFTYLINEILQEYPAINFVAISSFTKWASLLLNIMLSWLMSFNFTVSVHEMRRSLYVFFLFKMSPSSGVLHQNSIDQNRSMYIIANSIAVCNNIHWSIIELYTITTN